MWNLIARLIGVLFALFGTVLLAWLGRAFYDRAERWMDALAGLRMHSVLLLTLLAVVSIVGGLALAWRPTRPGLSARNSRYAHVARAGAAGNPTENKD